MSGAGRNGKRPFAGLLAAGLVAGAAAAGCADRRGAGDRARPDLVVVTIDTLRADHLGCYGYFRETSPRLDALAAGGLRFERCFAPIATTLPSHATLFTATEPLEHGVLANLGDGDTLLALPADLTPFAAHARSLGYRTAAVVSATPLKRGGGLEAGFEHWVEPAGAEARAGESVDAALAWLAQVPAAEPVLLWLHLFDPHGPYDPPAGFDVFDDGGADLDAHLGAREIRRSVARPGGRQVKTHRAFAGYDGEVLYTDHEVGRFVDGLRELGRWDRAAWLVVGDHGEGLGQHLDPGHGQVWNEQLRVPLLMGAPGVDPGTVPALLGMADVLPTWLALAGVPGRAEFLADRSGLDARSGRRAGVHGMTSLRRAEIVQGTRNAWTEERWKLIVGARGVEFLYDLERDPFELEDLAAEHPEHVARLRAALDRHVEQAHERGRRRAADPAPSAAASAARVEELRALGYVSGDDAEGDPAGGSGEPDGSVERR